MDISVIIVTFNSAEYITDCIQSVLTQAAVSLEIIVVDNASTDQTLERLQGLKCRVIPSQENLGFGRGCNLGFAASCGRYVYLLNPDARLVGEKALAKLRNQMDDQSGWGMAGTLVRYAQRDANSPPATNYPGSRHVRRDFSKLPGRIAWIVGASMIVRRECYEQLGGFDPAFFLYSEETDFCLRLRETGREIGYVPEVVVEHIGGASEDQRDPYDVAVRKLRGLILFRKKHYAPEDCVWLARRDLRRARFRAIWNGFLARLQPPHSKAWQKSRNYRAIRDISLQYLHSASNIRTDVG